MLVLLLSFGYESNTNEMNATKSFVVDNYSSGGGGWLVWLIDSSRRNVACQDQQKRTLNSCYLLAKEFKIRITKRFHLPNTDY